MRNFLKKIKDLFTKSDVEKTSLQKTARISIIFAAIAIVSIIVYFAVVAPMLKADEEYIPELFDGEVYQYNSIYILPQRERSEIKSVEIKNDVEHYKLNAYTAENGDVNFVIEGSEYISLSQEALSALLGDVRVLVTNSPAGQERVTVTATEADLANYGLDAASAPAWFEVSLIDGTSYKIYVGNPLVTTSGYYVRLEGRKNTVTDENGNTAEYDIIYALQTGLADTVLKGSETLVALDLAPYYGNNIYSATDFAVLRNDQDGNRDVVIRVGIVEDQGIAASAQVYKMVYPKSYVINEDMYTESVLTPLAYVQATAIVAYGEKIHTPEVYEKYGLDLDMERLENDTDSNYAIVVYNCMPTDTENYASQAILLYFSERFTDIDGIDYYYVYSPRYEIIGKVLASTYDFVDWSIAKYTNPYLFFEYFTSAESIDIYNEREGLDHRFVISGKERDRRVDVMRSGSDDEIVYKETADGGMIPLVYETKYRTISSGIEYYGDFEIFRDFYYVLITRSLALYAEVDESMTSVGEDVVATLAVTTSPKDHPISYYKYDSKGQKVTDSLRDEGGNILCHTVVVPTTLSDGTVKEITYDRAYYDIESGRFFLKAEDPFDANMKPSGFDDAGDGTVKVTTFLPKTAYGEYTETTYSFEFYDLYDEYVDAAGKDVRQLNPTYMYLIPSTTTKTYRLGSDGEKELISENTDRAEIGVYIRTATIDKLFSDTQKLLDGEAIDKMGVN
ncbi:MAG: hypothetical protein IJ489_04610 [Clostridia bacterium]|nr:hypothetical protein [Clostridia bacterium]